MLRGQWNEKEKVFMLEGQWNEKEKVFISPLPTFPPNNFT
jgi:hypothetical protein